MLDPFPPDSVGFLEPFRRPRFTWWANRWNVVLSDSFRTWALWRRGSPGNDCLVRAGGFLVWFCCLGPDWWRTLFGWRKGCFAYSSSRFCPFMRGDLLFALPQASCSRNVLHFIWSYRLPWCQGFELVYVGWRGDMCGSWLPAGATLLQ